MPPPSLSHSSFVLRCLLLYFVFIECRGVVLYARSFVLHIGTVESGSLRVGDVVRCEVDYERRTDIAPNHTMTHALNYALRKVRACVCLR